MKKSVVLILITVYVLALVVVGSIGANILVYEEKVYIEKVSIASVKMEQEALTIKKSDDGTFYCDAKTTKSEREKGVAFTIECAVLPADATNGKIEVQIDPTQQELVKNLTVSGTTVTFEVVCSGKPPTIKLIVKPEDSNLDSAKDMIFIRLKDKPLM